MSEDVATWEDLFGVDAEESAVAEDKGKKDKKEKKDKDEKKGKKDKKELRREKSPELDALPSPDMKDRKKKEKKDKTEKKEKKEKKDKKDEPEAPAVSVVKDGKEKKAKKDKKDFEPRKVEEKPPEKKSKEKKDKKEKSGVTKDGGPVLPFMASEASTATGVDKRDKKDKKDKDKKEKKEKKDKKRTAEEAQLDQPVGAAPSTAPAADVAGTGFGGGAFEDFDPLDLSKVFQDDTAAPETAAATPQGGIDSMFDEFGLDDVKDSRRQRGSGATDAFNDIFGDAFFTDAPTAGAAQDSGAAEDADFKDIFDAFDDDRKDVGGKDALMPVKLKVAPKVRAKKPKTAAEAKAEEEWPEAFNEKFMKVLENIKQKRPLSIKDDEAQKFVQEEIQHMFEAAKRDDACFGTNDLARHKIEMLPRVITIMNKYQFAIHFVTFNGCNALAAWLKNLPDGGLPNDHMRTKLLDCMLRLPITKEALANCSKENSLGTVVAGLMKNPKETVANRKIASVLVHKWVKQVLAKKTNFESEEVEVAQPKLVRPPLETAESLRLMEEESAKRIHPAIPIVGDKEYVIKPVPRHQPIKRDKVAVDTNRGKIGVKLKDMSRPNKKAWKPYAVSIAGKNVEAPV